MKGIVFTQLMEMVEQKYGYAVLAKTIKAANLPNEGLYISGGYYPHAEMQRILVELSKEAKVPVDQLMFTYGRHLFGKLVQMQPQLLEGKDNPLDFIASVDNYIHVEVRKLYPDADLPKFETLEHTFNKLVLRYQSSRHMQVFAHGMMQGCADHFGQPIDVHYEPEADGGTRFTITLSEQKFNEPLKAVTSESLWGRFKRLFRAA